MAHIMGATLTGGGAKF